MRKSVTSDGHLYTGRTSSYLLYESLRVMVLSAERVECVEEMDDWLPNSDMSPSFIFSLGGRLEDRRSESGRNGRLGVSCSRRETDRYMGFTFEILEMSFKEYHWWNVWISPKPDHLVAKIAIYKMIKSASQSLQKTYLVSQRTF